MRVDGLTHFELIFCNSNNTPINDVDRQPLLVLFVHVHKTYQNNLAIWALGAQTARIGKNTPNLPHTPNLPVVNVINGRLTQSNTTHNYPKVKLSKT